MTSEGAPADADGSGETSSIDRLRERAEIATREAGRRFDEAQRTRPWLRLPYEFFRRWTSTNATVLAGHLAYRVFVFLLPLVVVLVGLLGYASAGGTDLRAEGSSIGQSLANALSSTGSEAKDGRFQLVVFGGFAMLVAASGLVKALQLVFATAWRTSPKTGRNRLVILGRFLPGVLVVLAAVALRQWLSHSGLVLSIGSELLGIAINVVALLGLSWMLPRRATRFIDLVPGAVVGGVALGALHIAALVYFPHKIERASALYGTMGVVLVVLVYLFLVGEILVGSAIANAVWLDRAEIMAGPDSSE